MDWRSNAIGFAILSGLSGAISLGFIFPTGWRTQSIADSAEVATLVHLNEITSFLFILMFLLAAIFCALMDIGNSLRGRYRE
jgi:hypothetical protein